MVTQIQKRLKADMDSLNFASQSNLGLVVQLIIYPGKHSNLAQAHKNLFLAQKSRFLGVC